MRRDFDAEQRSECSQESGAAHRPPLGQPRSHDDYGRYSRKKNQEDEKKPQARGCNPKLRPASPASNSKGMGCGQSVENGDFLLACRTDWIVAHARAAQRTGRSAAWHRPPTVAEAPKVDARRLPDFDRNALCHGSCSALLDGETLGFAHVRRTPNLAS